MPYELIALLMVSTMLLLLFTGQRVFGAIAALVAAILKRRMTWAVPETSTRQTLGITCMFMWIITAALAFGAVFDGFGAVKAIGNLFTDRWGLDPWDSLILMPRSFVVMGTSLDDTAMLVLAAPLHVPLVGELGFDLVWYGVLYPITCQIAYMMPYQTRSRRRVT